MKAHEKSGGYDRPEVAPAAFEWLFQHALEPLLLTRPGVGILRANEAAIRALRMTEAEICTLDKGAIAVDNQAMRNLVAERIKTGSSRGQLILRRGDGSEFPAEVTTALLPDSPQPLAYVMFRDLTEREETARALRESEQRYAAIHDKAPVSIVLVKMPKGKIVSANAAFLELFEFELHEILGKTSVDMGIADAATRAKVADTFARNGFVRDMEVVRRTRTGRQRVLSLSLEAVSIAGEPHVMTVAVDITARVTAEQALRASEERLKNSYEQTRDALAALEKALDNTRRTEEKLRHVQKMEAIGRLAGGIAHDFNNLLSVILGNSSDVITGLSPADPLHETLAEIEKAGQRAAGLTRQLLAFSRKQVLEPRICNVNDLILGAEKMLRRIVGEDIELTVLLDQRPQLCKLDKGQFEQVLLNLVVNARDAMLDGGRLTIETTSVVLDASYVDEHPDASLGEHVRVTVSDTGVGIPKEVQAHIFEPFFTTKGMGRGTGLGLSTVYGIVRQSGGTIWVYSEPGRGSTFKVYFPRQTEGVVDIAPTMPNITTTRGRETILVVEDDEQVRATISGILRRAGYHVIPSANGGEALLICEQHGGSIQLLLTDVVMPKLNGPKLAERLRQVRPNMRVLFTSGYTENVVVHHGILDADLDFLAKPITSDALLTKVREILDR